MHVILIEEIYKTTPIFNFAKEYICIDDERDAVYVTGLYELFYAAYEKEELFSKIRPEYIG